MQQRVKVNLKVFQTYSLWLGKEMLIGLIPYMNCLRGEIFTGIITFLFVLLFSSSLEDSWFGIVKGTKK